MNETSAITYSLLAQIRNSGSLIQGPLDIFVPLVKRVLYVLSSDGLYRSTTLDPIKSKCIELYNIDFPIPVLKKVLSKIEMEINTAESINFKLHTDGSIIIKEFIFEDFEEKIQNSKNDVESLEKLFKEFCEINNISGIEADSIFDFIDKNRYTLSKYLTGKDFANGVDFTIQAKFVDYFKHSDKIYNIIRNIYLGSILTCYVQFKTEKLNIDVELLFDTNFIVSLLDLNTEESTHTCNKLLEICKNLGYKFSILKDTIEETQKLIRTKAEYFDRTFLQRRINPEDLYNACERRKLNRSDLERIADNIEELISEKGITAIHDTSRYKNIAKFSKEYESLKRIRNTETAALHDATAIYYIREKRGKRIKDFERVNCWFVNNSISHESTVYKEVPEVKDYQYELIKADELLNILWLSSPQVTSKISDSDLVEIGLSSIVAFTLNDSLPKAQIIRELDENITKYAKERLTSKDILNISTRIVNKQLKNLEQLNKIAATDSEEFVKKLQDEANKQAALEKARGEKFQELFKSIEEHTNSLKRKTEEVDDVLKTNKTLINDLSTKLQKSSNELKKVEEEEVKKQQIRIERFKDLKVKEWRRRSWLEFGISIILLTFFIFYILVKSNFNLSQTMDFFKSLEKNIIFASAFAIIIMVFTCFVINGLFQKYRNHSNIDAFRRNIKIPEDL
jgi:hypothetical protein